MKQRLLNILLFVLVPMVLLGSLELTIRLCASKRIKTYYDDQTEKFLGKPVPPKLPGEYRIFIFGGSSAYGTPFADEYTITSWLNKSFSHLLPNKKVTVINTAWPGHASHHELEGALQTLKYKPDLWIIYTGHNETFNMNRMFVDFPVYRWDLVLTYRSSLYRFLLKHIHKIQKHFRYGHSGQVEKHYREEILAKKLYKDDLLSEAEYIKLNSAFASNIESILRVAKRHKVHVLITNLPSNIRTIQPGKSSHKDSLDAQQLEIWEGWFQQGLSFQKKSLWKPAYEAFQLAEAIDPTYAELQFSMGLCCDKLSNFSCAKEHYLKAKDFNRAPSRAKTLMNDTLLSLANKYQTPFVDLVKAMERVSAQEIISNEMIMDDVHPTILGQQVISHEILRTLEPLQWIAPNEKWDWEALRTAQGDDTNPEWKVNDQLSAYNFILRGLHFWEKKFYDKAIPELEQGIVQMPDHFMSQVLLADAYFHTNKLDLSHQAFTKLHKLNPELLERVINEYPDMEQSYAAFHAGH